MKCSNRSDKLFPVKIDLFITSLLQSLYLYNYIILYILYTSNHLYQKFKNPRDILIPNEKSLFLLAAQSKFTAVKVRRGALE